MQTTQTISNFGNDVSFANLSDFLNSVLNEKKLSFKLRFSAYKFNRKIKKACKELEKMHKVIFNGGEFKITSNSYQPLRHFFDNSIDTLNNSRNMSMYCQKIIESEKFSSLPKIVKSSIHLSDRYLNLWIDFIYKTKEGLKSLTSEVKPSELPKGVRLLTEDDLWKERNKAYQFVI
ncbi:hypothetical protein [uncultured Microscilla sp.]|uniref:hypothetical protein n=1 Tax=uncultured Microscilla sp. TaxID=432653 RepID=UPI002623A011|nr:hypothetical protein [uncultured Microscilla sp.]